MKYSTSDPPPGVAIRGHVAAHREHAVQRAVDAAGHVGDDVVHRQQVLVVDRLFAQRVGHGDQFANRDQLARRSNARRVAAAYRDRLAARPAAAASPRPDTWSRRAGSSWPRRPSPARKVRDDDFLRHAEHRGLAPVDEQERLRRCGDAAVVDIDHACRLVEHARAPPWRRRGGLAPRDRRSRRRSAPAPADPAALRRPSRWR